MSLEVTRLDHHGIVAGIIKDLNTIELINEKLSSDPREEISAGEAIAGMIINGLGFTSKPLSLTPRFFANKPLEILFRDGVTFEHFNRSKLGRVLDKIYDYGCSKLFYEISTSCCLQEKINMKFNSLDTTTFSLHGEYDSCCDEQGIKVTHGFSKDHRADLKQVVQELIVSQDGGIPIMMKSWDGNANDNKIFLERSQELIDKFKDIEVPRYLIADSKLYSAENAKNLNQLNFITRIPRSNKEEVLQVAKAFTVNNWEILDNENFYFTEKLIHNDIKQRWIVVNSDAAKNRAIKNINRLLKEETSKVNSENKKFKKDKFLCKMDAEQQARELCKKIKYHTPAIIILEQQGLFILQIKLTRNQELIEDTINKRSCYTIGTNIPESELSDKEIIKSYKNQNASIENMGFRFLKDPVFFTSSLYLKKTSRIEGLLTIMTLSLLIYSIAQRRARTNLSNSDETIPNQINKPIKNPTARWLFFLLDGINIINFKLGGTVKKIINGLDDLKTKIVKLFGDAVFNIYTRYESEVRFVT